jgi:signal transduction histidine kinase/Flp pilus assembly protein TadD
MYSCSTQPLKLDQAKVPKAVADSVFELDSLVHLYRIADQSRAHHFATQALEITRQFPRSIERAKALNMLAVTYILNKPDSALWCYQQALKIASKPEMLKTKMLVLSNIGTLYTTYGEHNMAISYFDSVITCTQNYKLDYSTAEVYLALGAIYFDIGNAVKAKENFDRSLSIATKQNKTKQIALALANLATINNDESLASKQYHKALQLLGTSSSNLEEKASILVNLGLLEPNPQKALKYYQDALLIVEKKTYPIFEVGAYNNMAYTYMDLGDYEKAKTCLIEKGMKIALALKDYQWLSTLHDSYADLLVKTGNAKDALASQKKALEYLVLSNQDFDSKQTRLLMAQMEEREKDFTIKQQEAKLDLQTKRQQLISTLLLLALALVLVLVLLLRVVRQRSLRKLQQQKLMAAKKLMDIEEHQKSKLGLELHDISGQLVMGLRGAVEGMIADGIEEAPELKNRIMEIGQSIRRISHRMDRTRLLNHDLKELLTDLCKDMQTLSNLKISLYCPNGIPQMEEDLITNIYRIVQELITNGLKHSGAPELYIALEPVSATQLNLYYQDDGKGFDSTDERILGFGLQGIVNRAMLMGAKFNLNTAPGKGTRIELSIELHKTQVQ